MIFLVRHGQSTWNVQRRTQGQTPHPPLTALGREQAAGAAQVVLDHLAGRAVDLVVSSDLVRAHESAVILAGLVGAGLRVDERLRERALGRVEGLGSAESLAMLADHDWRDPDLSPGGGETARQVHERMAAVISDHLDATTVLVTHGDAIRSALGWWSGHEPARDPWVDIASSAVFVLDEPGRWTCLSAAPAPPT